MKTIVLLVAVLAMVGFASAWETTEQMQYAYQKSVSMQAGQDLTWLTGATSSAQYQSNTAYGQSNAFVSNGVTAIVAPLQTVTGSTSLPDTHNTLTQTGSATTTTSAPDLENPAGIKISGTASTSEDLHLSGNYGGCTGVAAEALLKENAVVGVDGTNVAGITNNPATNPGNWPSTSTSSENPFTGMIETANSNSYVVEADIGASTTSGFQQIQAVGALPTMSGSSSSYAGFSGAYATSGMPSVETSVAGSTGFGMFGTWAGATGFTGTSV